MPRGYPDFGPYAPKEVGASLADMGELAVRLGSIDTFDRRGDVVFMDDFEDPVLKWVRGVVAPESIILDATNVRSGSQAVKITTRAVFPLGPIMTKSIYSLGSRRLGAEVHFSYPPDTSLLKFFIYHYDGAHVYQAEAQIDFGNGNLTIRDITLGDITVASGLTFPSENFCFTPLKMVADFSTNKFVRILLGNKEYDISSYSLYSVENYASARDRVRIQINNDITATAASIWVDDAILTQNEP